MRLNKPTRRTILAGAFSGALASCTHEPSAEQMAIGLQLYTLLAETRSDPTGTLARVKAFGIQDVEILYGVHTEAPFVAELANAGLRARSIHAGAPALSTTPDEVFARAAEIGVDWVVCPIPPAPAGAADGARPRFDSMTAQDWRALAQSLNDWGQRARASGVRFAYHNHDFDYMRIDGAPAFHRLAEWTDPALVAFELDCGWAAAAGFDPASEIRRLGQRCRMLHVKDVAPREGARWQPVPLGEGVVDFRSVLSAAAEVGVAIGFVEQDPPFSRPVYDCLDTSFAHLRSLGALGAENH